MVVKAKTEAAEDVLELFKGRDAEDSTALLWFRSNPDVASLVMAWSKVPVTFTGDAPKRKPKKITDLWVWLWRNYTFEYSAWMGMANITDFRYGSRLISRILSLRLVYPDSTIPPWITEFIKRAATYELSKKKPIVVNKPKPEKEKEPKKVPEELEDEE